MLGNKDLGIRGETLLVHGIAMATPLGVALLTLLSCWPGCLAIQVSLGFIQLCLSADVGAEAFFRGSGSVIGAPQL